MTKFLAAHPISADSPLNFEFPDEEILLPHQGAESQAKEAPSERCENVLTIELLCWELYFDGAF